MIPIPKEDLLKMRGGTEKQIADTILDLMIELGQWDIGNMPMPTFIGLVKRINERNKELEREMKWQNRR